MTYVNRSPNNIDVISATSSVSGRQEYLHSTNHALDVNLASDIIIGNINLTEVGGANIVLGQTTMSASLPVTIASNQTALPVSQSGTWNIATVTAVTAITNALPVGSNVIGHVITDTGSTTAVTGTVTISGTVNQGTSPWIVAGGGTAGTPGAAVLTVQGVSGGTAQPVNHTLIAGNAVLTGNGVTGNGSQRVTIASDNTAFGVNATLSAETTKVIGTVNQGTSPWVVGQSTAANLNATVVGTGTFATQITANPLVASPLVGQSAISVTGTAVRLNGGTSQPLTNGIIISAPAGNTTPISVGPSSVNNTQDGTGNGYLLAPGASISFAVNNTNDIYINGHSGDYISWAGS